MSPLNTNQIRHVVVTFAHVDGLLDTIDRLAGDTLSPFAKERPDFAPDEARLMRSFVALARARMLAALDRLGIPRPQPTTSARWTVSTSLTFADIALSEITAGNLAGYGAVDAGAATELEALASDLRTVVARGKALLHEHDPGGLAERIASVPGAAGEVLRAVERLTAERGIAELRPLIAAAAERATATTFDVGVFGRVSAGKSSLINALVDTPVLPVGATPVTAVPIRIAHGAAAAQVLRLDGSATAIAVGEIPEYATEACNPQNTKGVRAIEVTLPGVAPGLRLLDTPGVGSLGSSGPAQAFAWLPRCDLGLVLIAAGTAVGSDDLALIAGLGRAGIACRVLLSKADLLTEHDLATATAYVNGEIAGVLGPASPIDVLPVSTVAGQDARLVTLRRDVLAPLAADHSQAAAAALRGRLHRLVAATQAALDGQDTRGEARLDAYEAQRAARDVIHREADRLATGADAVLAEVADAVTAAWATGKDGDAAARRAILDAGASTLARVRDAIEAARRAAGGDATARQRIPPLFDPAFVDALPPLAPPPLGARMLGRRIALGRLDPIAARLREALTRYAGRLHAWGSAQLDELADAAESGRADAHVLAHPDLRRLDTLIDSG